MSHVTATDMHMLYDGLLNEDQSARVREHLDNCDECRAQFQLVSDTLTDLQSGRIKRLSRWQFRKLWKRILAVESMLRPSGFESVEEVESQRVPLDQRSGSQPVLYATASGTAEAVAQIPGRATPAIVCVGGQAEHSVPAYWEVLEDQDNRLSACVRIADDLNDLEDMEVRMECFNSFDRVAFRPARLVKEVKEPWGEVLLAHMELESEPSVPITKRQLREMNAHVKITRT